LKCPFDDRSFNFAAFPDDLPMFAIRLQSGTSTDWKVAGPLREREFSRAQSPTFYVPSLKDAFFLLLPTFREPLDGLIRPLLLNT